MSKSSNTFSDSATTYNNFVQAVKKSKNYIVNKAFDIYFLNMRKYAKYACICLVYNSTIGVELHNR